MGIFKQQKVKNIVISDNIWKTYFLKNKELTRVKVYFDKEKKNYMEIDIRQDLIMINFPNMKIDDTIHNDYGFTWKKLFKLNFDEVKALKVWNLVLNKLNKEENNTLMKDPKKEKIKANELFKED
jgi:hypothetical protein